MYLVHLKGHQPSLFPFVCAKANVFHCKSEIRSRVVPACLAPYLHICLCPLWLFLVAFGGCSCFEWSSCQWKILRQGIPLGGRLERTSAPHVVRMFGSPCCSRSAENTSLGWCNFCQERSRATPAPAVPRMRNSLAARERRCRLVVTGPLSEAEATVCWARTSTIILIVLAILKFILHCKNSQIYTKVERIVYEPPYACHSCAPYAS